jgi:hypothetical protein
VARLDVALDRTSILAGDRVTVDARFVDPRDGKPLTPDQAGVRFNPPRRVTATFYHGQLDADAVVVELQPVGFGHYRGSVSLAGPQVWSLQVDATRDNGPGSRVSLASAVVAQAAFAASDGHRYLLQLTSEPASPVAGQPVTLRLAFVDATSRQPLPEGVNLSEELPDSIDVALFLGNGDLSQAREMHACTLRPDGAGRGVYTGGLTLDQPGGWSAQISFALGGQAVRALAGSIQVGAP